MECLTWGHVSSAAAIAVVSERVQQRTLNISLRRSMIYSQMVRHQGNSQWTRPMEGIYSPQQYFLAQNAGDEYVCSFEQKVTSANFNIPSRTSNNIAGPALAVSAVSLIHQTCNLLVLGFPSQFWLRFYTSMIDVHTGWHALRVISVSPANTQRGIIFIVATVRKKQLKHLNIGFCHLFYRIATLQLSAHGQLWSANFPHSCRQSSPRRLTPRRSNEFLSR